MRPALARLTRLLLPTHMQKRGASSAASAPAAALVRGSDADGTKYTTAEELWQQERSKGLQQSWYSAAISYWSSVPATVDGVLGGYGRVSPLDLTESASFLDALAAQGCSVVHCPASNMKLASGIANRAAMSAYTPPCVYMSIKLHRPAWCAHGRLR